MDLTRAAVEVLEPLGYEVLEVTVSASGRTRQVLLGIDRLDEGVVTVDDVTRAAEVFGLELDRLDPFETPYRLDVESPGAQRPLFTKRHFERFHDLLVKFRAGGEAYKGRVVGEESPAEGGVDGSTADDTVTFLIDGEKRTFRLDDLEQARLAEWPDTPR